MPDVGTLPPRTGRYFPLCIKILGWLMANIALLALAALGMARFHFHFGPESFLEGRMGDRLEKIGSSIAAELQLSPSSEWNSLLGCLAGEGNLQPRLLRADGKTLAGPDTPLPQTIRERMASISKCGPAPGAQKPPSATPEDKCCAHRFAARAGTPEKLWLGVRLEPAPPDQTLPVFLVFAFDSLLQGRFLFDWVPWIGAAIATTAASILFWTPLVRGIARSLQQMRDAAIQIAQGRFTVRVPEDRSDDLGQLGASINHMASRLDALVSGQKRFLGDIAHELCSPLARMEVALGVLEHRIEPGNAAPLEDVRDEVRHMSGLLHELLSFTRAELGARPALVPVPVSEAVERAIQTENLPPEVLEIGIHEKIRVLADPVLLERALGNLLRNAFRYASHAGPIRLSASVSGSTVQIRVEDSGPGVPEESLPRLFEPFYRPELDRNRDSGGTGLGLAIVRSCIQSCGGAVAAKNRTPSGLEITISLSAAT